MQSMSVAFMVFATVGVGIITLLQVAGQASTEMVVDSTAYNGTKQILVGGVQLSGALPLIGAVLGIGIVLSLVFLFKNPPDVFTRL